MKNPRLNKNSCVILDEILEEATRLKDISVRTLRMMDKAMENYAKKIVSKPVDIEELRKITASLKS